jgi:hypothetical protein
VGSAKKRERLKDGDGRSVCLLNPLEFNASVHGRVEEGGGGGAGGGELGFQGVYHRHQVVQLCDDARRLCLPVGLYSTDSRLFSRCEHEVNNRQPTSYIMKRLMTVAGLNPEEAIDAERPPTR